MYYVLLTYLCTSCILVQCLCFHNHYCVVSNLTNALIDVNSTVWGQGQYVYSIATFNTVLCCCCRVFRKLSLLQEAT